MFAKGFIPHLTMPDLLLWETQREDAAYPLRSWYFWKVLWINVNISFGEERKRKAVTLKKRGSDFTEIFIDQ